MELKNALLPGAGGLIVGLLLGVALSGSGDDAANAGLRETKALSEKLAAVEASVAGLGGKVDGIEGALKTQGEGVAALGPKLDEVVTSISGNVEKLGAGVSDAVKAEIAGLKSDLANMMPSSAPAVPAEPADAAAAVPATGTALTPGSTVLFGEGKVRVFMSMADQEGGLARVGINGRDLTQLMVNEPVEKDGCQIMLTGFDAAGLAMIDGSC